MTLVIIISPLVVIVVALLVSTVITSLIDLVVVARVRTISCHMSVLETIPTLEIFLISSIIILIVAIIIPLLILRRVIVGLAVFIWTIEGRS